MMENRSYDHVLGYRAQAPTPDGADGLTEATIEAIQAAAGGRTRCASCSDAGFAGTRCGTMTRLPKWVGHELDDVREQLAAPGAASRWRADQRP